MKQQSNEISALRSKLTQLMAKQPVRRHVFNTGCVPAEEVVVDTEKALEEKLSAGSEAQLQALRQRVSELEEVVKKNNAMVSVDVGAWREK